MKRVLLILLCLLVLFGCGCEEAQSKKQKAKSEEEATPTAEAQSEEEEAQSTEAQSTKQKAKSEEEATPCATEEPVVSRTADVGYYHEETRTSLVEGVTYINLFGTRIYYTVPNEMTFIPLEGEASNWEISEDKYSIVKDLFSKNGKLYIETSGTGYIYLVNKAINENATLYVNKEAPKTEERKQTNEALPYYLYLEKGSYSNFQEDSIALTVYKVDEEGYYTVPYLTICTACGKTPAKTPVGYHKIAGHDAGTFTMNGREYWHDWGTGYYGQYAMIYASGVYLHGGTTLGKDESMGYVDYYNQVGTHASSGCLRMQTGSIYWIWTNCPNGTTLEIVDGNPLGTCIEKNETIEGDYAYDPTDPYLLTKEHYE